MQKIVISAHHTFYIKLYVLCVKKGVEIKCIFVKKNKLTVWPAFRQEGDVLYVCHEMMKISGDYVKICSIQCGELSWIGKKGK